MTPGREPVPAAGPAGSRSVLPIDAAVVRTLGRFFAPEGWDVQRACSGEDGLGAFEAGQPDLVLLDLDLPGLDGLGVLEVLTQRDAVVLMLTGRGDIPAAVEAMRLGAELAETPARPAQAPPSGGSLAWPRR